MRITLSRRFSRLLGAGLIAGAFAAGFVLPQASDYPLGPSKTTSVANIRVADVSAFPPGHS
jgi:hypothetical protein